MAVGTKLGFLQCASLHVLALVVFSYAYGSTEPKHVHLSVTNKRDEITVMWYTEDAAQSFVQYAASKRELEKGPLIKGSSRLLIYSDATTPGYQHGMHFT